MITHEKMWAASFVQAACGVTAEDTFYINLPLYHSAGFLIGMVGSIERGDLSDLVSNPRVQVVYIKTKQIQYEKRALHVPVMFLKESTADIAHS